MSKLTKILRKIRFYTAEQFRASLGIKLSQKMFEYLRDTVGLIPSPIKFSRGRGAIALYPNFVVEHMRSVVREKLKGLNYMEIREQFQEQTQNVFDKAEAWRTMFEKDEAIKSWLMSGLKAGDQPASRFKTLEPDMILRVSDLKALDNVKLNKGDIIFEIKGLMKQWDGKSIDDLRILKHKIEELEQSAAYKELFSNARYV